MKHNKENEKKKIQNKKLSKDEINSKKNEQRAKKHPFRRLFIFALILFLIAATLYLSFKAYIFKTLSKEMFNNMPSSVFDSNKNVIAQIINTVKIASKILFSTYLATFSPPFFNIIQ